MLLLIFILIIGVITTGITISFVKYNENKKEQEELQRQNKILEDIKSHYNEFVITNKETKLYKKEKNKYIESGKINKNIYLTLKLEEEISLDIKYFYIPDFDLYIYYEDVDHSEQYIKEDRYMNYIYFNNNITTKNITSFYDEEDNYLYTINKSFDFKVLIKDENKYGVVFNNELLYIKSEDVEKIYENVNTELKNKSKIKTLTYHFLYDPEIDTCYDSICQSLDQFESHLKYLKDNNYFTLRLNELELYLDGKLQIPQKSIVLTIDDGTIFNRDAIGILEEYDLNATLFAITGWVDPNTFISENLDLESHTDKMHNQYECPGYGSQGGGILCLPEDVVLKDLKTSQEKLGGSKYFAYPFFDFNDRAISLLKQAGFNMAFIGQYDSDGDSYPNITDKYKVRRKTIFITTTMEEFISYLQ